MHVAFYDWVWALEPACLTYLGLWTLKACQQPRAIRLLLSTMENWQAEESGLGFRNNGSEVWEFLHFPLLHFC